MHAGQVVPVGRTPPVADLLALAGWLRARPETTLLHTDRLASAFPAFAPHADIASGLLAVFVSSDRDGHAAVVPPRGGAAGQLGRRPAQADRGAPDTAPGQVLPRQSFERWVEVRHGRARSWETWELELAGQLRHAITEVVVRGLRRVNELDEQLRQSQKMEAVGQLTGGLAHDFNNLLTGITGSLELLQNRIARGGSRSSTATSARPRARPAGGGPDPPPAGLLAPADAGSAAHRRQPPGRRHGGAGPAHHRRRHHGRGRDGGRTVATLCDPNQLENALLNLCINARDAMPDGGRLTVETANRWLDERAARQRDMPPGQYVSLCVSDTGTGMTPEVIARAFDPFFTTKPLGQGTGLGLSMIYGFARQSGGQARIYSELGQGTSVCLYLPRHLGAADEAERAEAAAPLARAEHGETVLVVDDEPTVRMLVTEVLEELGYRALEAGDGAVGAARPAVGPRIDLLVTDVGLPGGHERAPARRRGARARPGLKVLFITGYAENAVARPRPPGARHARADQAVLGRAAGRAHQGADCAGECGGVAGQLGVA